MKTVIALGLLLVVAAVVVASFVRFSGGTWYIREAPTPQGWPALTPIGTVEVKDYPATRAAVIREAAEPGTPARRQMDGMFNPLFNHIKSRDIAMTAPVDMTFAQAPPDTNPPGQDQAAEQADRRDEQSPVASMAFLYRTPTQGVTETNGRVAVEDQPARAYASLGLRGNYTGDHLDRAIAQLDGWLEQHADTWQPTGPPRYLGYNSPFVPPFLRYGQVQRPVQPVK